MKISIATKLSLLKTAGPRLMRSGLYLLAIFLFCLSFWIHRSFGKPDLDQLTYHLNYGFELLRTSDPVFAERFVKWCVLVPLLLLALCWYGEPRVWRVIAKTPQRCRALLYRLHGWFPQLLMLGATAF